MTPSRCQLEWGPVTNGTTTVESKSCCQVDAKLGVAPQASDLDHVGKSSKNGLNACGQRNGIGLDGWLDVGTIIFILTIQKSEYLNRRKSER